MSTLGSSGAGAGVTVAVGGGGGVAGLAVAAGAGFLATAGGFGFGFAAGLFAAGVSAPGGVSEICATALAVHIRQLVTIDIARRSLISGAIPARLSLFRARHRPAGSPASRPSGRSRRRAD